MYTHTHNNNCKQVTDTSDPERARVAHNEASLLQRLSSAAGSSTLAPARGSTSSNCSSSSPDASDVRHTTCSHRSHQAQQSGQQQGRQATKQQNIAQQRHRQDRQQQQQQQQQQPRSNFVSRCQREHPAALSSCDLQQGQQSQGPSVAHPHTHDREHTQTVPKQPPGSTQPQPQSSHPHPCAQSHPGAHHIVRMLDHFEHEGGGGQGGQAGRRRLSCLVLERLGCTLQVRRSPCVGLHVILKHMKHVL
jgi:hypothetical protein